MWPLRFLTHNGSGDGIGNVQIFYTYSCSFSGLINYWFRKWFVFSFFFYSINTGRGSRRKDGNVSRPRLKRGNVSRPRLKREWERGKISGTGTPLPAPPRPRKNWPGTGIPRPRLISCGDGDVDYFPFLVGNGDRIGISGRRVYSLPRLALLPSLHARDI